MEHVYPIAQFQRAQRGNLVPKVLSGGKRVEGDGLGVSLTSRRRHEAGTKVVGSRS